MVASCGFLLSSIVEAVLTSWRFWRSADGNAEA